MIPPIFSFIVFSCSFAFNYQYGPPWMNDWIYYNFVLFISSESGNIKPSITHVLVASSVGLIVAASAHYGYKRSKNGKIIPRIKYSKCGRLEKLERFSDYVGKNQYHTTWLQPVWNNVGCFLIMSFDLSCGFQLDKWVLRVEMNAQSFVSWLLNISEKLKGVKKIYTDCFLRNQIQILCLWSFWRSLRGAASVTLHSIGPVLIKWSVR